VISKQQFQDADASLDAAEASVQSAESGVEDASVDLAYIDIRSPISGIVASVSTQQGETVAASFATPHLRHRNSEKCTRYRRHGG
jgi:HlyD family secretion protein